MSAINQYNTIENFLIYHGKLIKTWVPDGWTPISGTDSYIAFNKNFLSFGIKDTPLVPSTANVLLSAFGSKPSLPIISNFIDGDIVFGISTSHVSSLNTNKNAVIIGSKNSTIESNLLNTVILAGDNIHARISNTVHVPKLTLQRKASTDILHNTLTDDSTDSLYNLNGSLWFNGVQLVSPGSPVLLLPTPTASTNTLYTDGLNWLETNILTVDIATQRVGIKSPTGTSKTTFKIASNTAGSIFGRVQFEYLGTESTTSYSGFVVSDSSGNLNRFNLSNSTKYLRGDGTWQNIVPITNGVLVDQTLRWNGTSWAASSGLRTNSVGKVSISGISGFASMDANTKLQVGGAIMIEDLGVPTPTTEKLYNIGGTLYWNNQLLTGYVGTTVGSHLVWNGTDYIEQTDFLTINTINSSKTSQFISNDTAGINTLVELGKINAANRGFLFNIQESGNLTNGSMSLQLPYSGLPIYNLLLQDNNIPKFTEIVADPDVISFENNDSITSSKLTISPSQIIFNGGLVNKVTIITSNLLLSNQYICAVRTTLGVYTLTLPITPRNGTTYVIKDAENNASGNNITINPNGATIDTVPGNLVLIANGDTVTLTYVSALLTWIKI